MKVTPKPDIDGGVELRAGDRKAFAPLRPGAAKQGTVASGYFAYVLLAALLAHALLIAGAMVYMAKSTSRIRDVSAQLNALSEFEARINEKISAQNVAVQTLINETNDRLSTIRSDVEAAAAANQDTLRTLGELQNRLDSRRGFTEFRSSQPDLTAEPADAANSDQADSSLPKPPPGYRRIREANGSVTYEKIR